MHSSHSSQKVFVGGLASSTTQERLQQFFSRFGEVISCVVATDNETGGSRGFGFVTFSDPGSVDLVIQHRPHELDGKTIDPKLCNPNSFLPETASSSRVFLGGLPSNTSEAHLRAFFSRLGTVIDVLIMYSDRESKPRGFGFVSFEDDSVVERLVAKRFVEINGKQVEVKRAEPRDHAGGEQRGGRAHSWRSSRSMGHGGDRGDSISSMGHVRGRGDSMGRGGERGDSMGPMGHVRGRGDAIRGPMSHPCSNQDGSRHPTQTQGYPDYRHPWEQYDCQRWSSSRRPPGRDVSPPRWRPPYSQQLRGGYGDVISRPVPGYVDYNAIYPGVPGSGNYTSPGVPGNAPTSLPGLFPEVPAGRREEYPWNPRQCMRVHPYR